MQLEAKVFRNAQENEILRKKMQKQNNFFQSRSNLLLKDRKITIR